MTTAEPIETLQEDIVPDGPGLPEVFKDRPPTHEQKTRKIIAITILAVLFAFYGAILGTFLWGSMDVDKLHAATASISGVQALAAAAVGFYYGSRKK